MIPSPEQVVSECWPLLDRIREAIRQGCVRAGEYPLRFGVGDSPDVWLSPGIVRYHVLKGLESETLPLGAKLVGLANNGLLFAFKGRYLRVMKSDEGDLPVPGRSHARRAFYHQLGLGLDQEDETLKLLLLWDVDDEYGLSDLTIACPKSGDVTRASVEAHWNYPLPLYGAPVPDETVDDWGEDLEDRDLGAM